MRSELEERLTRLPDQGYEDPAPEHITISMITFAYDNAELINLLRQRGSFVKFEKYDKMREINNKIDAIKSDRKKLESLNRPVTAFLTFENEEGINRAKVYNDIVYSDDQYQDIRTLLGCKLEIEDAAEPTDIIWENRHFTPLQRFNRSLIVIGCVLVLLLISFAVIFFLTKQSQAATIKYPYADCNIVTNDYSFENLRLLAY